jgi:hypothetical protein
MKDEALIGGAWLAARHGIELVAPLAVTSRIGGRRTTGMVDGMASETFVPAMRPAPDLRGHLTFHLKHEVPHLELLARLFGCIDPGELTAWIDAEPGGQYARRAGFLFEWLTGDRLPITAAPSGGYVDALDPSKLVTAPPDRAVPHRRWRVRDNLPGTPAFCPMIRRTRAFDRAASLDIPALLAELEQEFGEDLLMRSAVWMTLRESRSSFAIEGEADQTDRIQRFADVLARRTGQGPVPLDDASLAQLQSAILGPRHSLPKLGVRESPVFVGEVIRYQEVIHYLAPPAAEMPGMLAGLAAFLDRTQDQAPMMRCAAGSFGFVYIHPLADGNGRVHRFLINDLLRRDGAVPEPLILPVSSLMTRNAAERRAYDRILDALSRPLMSAIAGLHAFGATQTVYPDGVRSNIEFWGAAIAQPAWRYPDLTPHVVYLADAVERTIREDMRGESLLLRSHAQARAAIKTIIEMPDMQIDRIIRSVRSGGGTLSGLLRRELPLLAEPGIWDSVVDAVNRAFIALTPPATAPRTAPGSSPPPG